MKNQEQQPATQQAPDKTAKEKPAPSAKKPNRRGAENIARYNVKVI